MRSVMEQVVNEPLANFEAFEDYGNYDLVADSRVRQFCNGTSWEFDSMLDTNWTWEAKGTTVAPAVWEELS